MNIAVEPFAFEAKVSSYDVLLSDRGTRLHCSIYVNLAGTVNRYCA